MTETRWLQFFDFGLSDSGKTRRWTVRVKESGDILGEIRWFGRWRRYAFFPGPGTVFEQDCLRDLAAFCEARMAERRKVLA